MEKLPSSQINRVTVLSNIVLPPLRKTSQNENLADADIVDITIDDSDGEEESAKTSGEPQLFKNLFFDLPTKHGYSQKRKRDISLIKQCERKKIKIEKEFDSEQKNCDDDEVERVFNYMTGAYEIVRRSEEIIPREHRNVKNDPDITIEEVCLKEEAATIDTVQDRPHLIDGHSTADTISTNAPGEDGHQESNESQNDISFNLPSVLDASPSPILAPTSRNIPEVIAIIAESQSPCNNNHSILTVKLPVENSPSVDESSNDTIIIASESNSVSENNNSLTVVESSPVVLKNLVVKTALSQSSETSSLNSLETENENNYSDPSCLNLEKDVTESNDSKQEKHLADRLPNWNCKTCGLKSKTKGDLISHIYNEHLKDDYEMKIKCKNCNFECDTPSEMERHELGHEKSISDCSSPIKDNQTHVNSETCGTIGENLKQSASGDNLPSKRLRCYFCTYKTNDRCNLREHAKRHVGKQFYCEDHFWTISTPTCPKCIFQNILFKLSDSLLTCEICGFATTRRCKLKRHASRPFSCRQYLARKTNKKKRIKNYGGQNDISSQLVKKTSAVESLLRKPTIVNVSVAALENPVTSQNISNEHGPGSAEKIGKVQDVESNLQNDDDLAKTTENSDNITVQQRLDNEISSTNTSSTKQVGNENFVQSEEQVSSEKSNSFQNEKGSTEDLDISLDPGQNQKKSDSTAIVVETVAPNGEASAQDSADSSETANYLALPNNNSKKRKNSDNSESDGNDLDDLDVDESDSSPEQPPVISFKCFDCDIIVSEKDELKTHALSRHPNSSFKCDVHKSKIGFHECDKCIYELLFRNSKIGRSLIDPFDMVLSRISNLEVKASKQQQLSHYKEPGSTIRDSDSDTDVSDIEVTEVRMTRGRALKNTVEETKNSSPYRKANDSYDGADSDVVVVIDADDSFGEPSTETNNVEKTSDTTRSATVENMGPLLGNQKSLQCTTDKNYNSENQLKGQCFDCKFVAENLPAFKKHVCRHLGSKYQCMDHRNKFKECPKCYYEIVLQNLCKEVKCCGTCGYRTLNECKIARHLCGKWYCRKLLPGELICFKCQYITTDKKLMIYHMVDHLDQEFCCEKHDENKDDSCLHCINKECLESAKKEVKTCEKCNLKTAMSQLFDIHHCDKNISLNSIPLEKFCNNEGEGNDGSSAKGNKTKTSGDRTNTEIIDLCEDSPKGQCFDCQFVAENLPAFKKHVCRHLGSKYQCMDHRNKFKECPKCYYEIVLQNLSKEVKCCETCGYRTLNECKMARHLCGKWYCRKLLPEEVICFKCQYITIDKKLMIYHMVDHLDQEFSCEKHGENKDDICLHCINKECLDTAKKEVKTCEKCNLKTAISQLFDIHHCDKNISLNSIPLEEMCNNEAEGNVGSSAKENKTKTSGDSTNTEIIDLCEDSQNEKEIGNGKPPDDFRNNIEDDTEISTTENSTSNLKNTDVNDKKETTERCFDCNFSGTGSLFYKHIWRHIGSKYRCLKHLKSKRKDCQRCRYVEALKSARKTVTHCTRCSFTTPYVHNLKRHMMSTETCSRWTAKDVKPGEMRCLVCHYLTSHKVLLKCHMVDHLDLTLSCEMRHVKGGQVCELCRNQECLELAKKEVKRCEKCNFKTVIKEVFDIHDCERKLGGNSVTSSEHGDSIAGEPGEKDEETLDATLADNSEVSGIKAKCFDCKYSSSEDDITFKQHVCRHVGSKYQCMEHWKSKVKDCFKCHYEQILQVLQTEVKICKTCGYKALDQMCLNSHLEEVDSCSKRVERDLQPDELRCLKCEYVTRHKKFLKYHMVDHLDVTFTCDVHQENKGEKCHKCIYEKCLETAKKDAKTCEKCNFTTAIKQVFNLHDCEGKGTNNGSVERSLEKTIQDISNVNKTDFPGNSIQDQTNISGIETDTRTSNSKAQGVNSKEVNGSKRKKAQCFDCDFSTPVQYFLNHVCRHIGSKYQCVKHHKVKSTDCQKCYYEETLKSAAEHVRCCKNCGYKTVDSFNLKRHLNGEESCKKWLKRIPRLSEIMCLMCSYMTAHKIFLKYHMVDHLDEKLPDHAHLGQKDEDEMCQSCLNEECLENAKKEVKICEKCKFKTVVKQIFDLHDCDKNKQSTGQKVWSAPEAKGSKSKEDNADEAPLAEEDVDVNSRQSTNTTGDGGMENDISRRIKAKCFDCKYSSENDKTFRQHVCRHIGSKYQCMEHWKSKVKNCLKCHYEEVVKELRRVAKTCNICRYKALDEMDLTRHLNEFGSCSKWINRNFEPEEIRCLECQYVTVHKKYLKYHMVDHIDVELSCGVHRESKNEKCEKCINKECLEYAKNEVKMCEKCEFKTVVKQIFNVHVCGEVMKPEEVKQEISRNTKGAGSETILENVETSNDTQKRFENDVYPSPKKINDVKENEIKAQCFDCKFSCADKCLKFKEHICRHKGSKFQCMEHPKLKRTEDCLKCYYEVTLDYLHTQVISCPTCGYTTVDMAKLADHKNGKDTCKKWKKRKLKPGRVRCFECQYVTTRKKFLKYHMVDHLEVEFSCATHGQDKDEDCLECIYETALESAKREAIICDKCNFKSAIRRVFKEHECKEQNKTVTDTSKTFTCFDCDEFICHTTDELREHAEILHHKSGFKCDEHYSGDALENCSKCTYQNILESASKDVSLDCSIQNGEKDGDSESENVEQNSTSTQESFRCYHCEYRGQYKGGLRRHAIRHYGERFKCDVHVGGRGFNNCRKCLYVNILKSYDTVLKVCQKCQYKTLNEFHFENHVKRNDCGSIGTAGGSEHEQHFYKCFDCGVTYVKEYDLKTHARNHIGSTFKCDDHGEGMDRNCPKCIYEDIVKNIDTITFMCGTCGYKAFTWPLLIRHQKKKVDCGKAGLVVEGKNLEVSGKIYRCFDCDFSHARKDFLTKHVMVHGNSTFQCDEHEKPTEECPKCLYRELLNQNLGKCRCFDCVPPVEFAKKFNLKRHIFRCHKDSTYVCTSHSNPVETCARCVYACLVKQMDQLWRNQLVCWDCKGERFGTKEKLKDHIKELHLRSGFACDSHLLSRESDSCPMCVYEELVQICRRESGETVADPTKKIPRGYRCFDCGFKTFSRPALSAHVRRSHVKSDYSCAEHSLGDIDEASCAMCRYESVLVSTKQSVAVKCSK